MHDAIDDTQKQNIEYFNEFTLLNNGIFSGLKDDCILESNFFTMPKIERKY